MGVSLTKLRGLDWLVEPATVWGILPCVEKPTLESSVIGSNSDFVSEQDESMVVKVGFLKLGCTSDCRGL